MHSNKKPREWVSPLTPDQLEDFHQSQAQYTRRKNEADRCRPYPWRPWDRGNNIYDAWGGDAA